MTLPTPDCPRIPTHQRRITIQGYRREDGLWDVEGLLIDVRSQDVALHNGIRRAGEPIHLMHLRLTVDASATIVSAHAATEEAPFGTGVCGAVTPRYQALVGLSIGRGYRQKIQGLFGGVQGCAHLSELAISLGTGVLQTLAGELPQSEDVKPFQLDGCHALSTDGPQVAHYYPRWHRSH